MASRLLFGASESNITTGTPLSTALSIASVNLLASEALMAMPLAPAFTNCSTASACFCGSSSFGVRQSILMVTPFSLLSFAASSSAPVLAAWNTGLLLDLATMPNVYVRLLVGVALIDGLGIATATGAVGFADGRTATSGV